MQNKILRFTNLCLMTSSVVVGLELLSHSTAFAVVLWDTLEPRPSLGISSQPNASIPTEAADDFFFLNSFASNFQVEEIKFNGLFSDPDATIENVHVELYQSFPFDSVVPPSGLTVRDNGPADNAFAEFDFEQGEFDSIVIDESFTVDNTIRPDPVAPFSAVEAAGLTGELREITVALTDPIILSAAASGMPGEANHYFLAITVETSNNSDYYWVAGQRPPVVPPGVVGDRQSWLRTDLIAPDWVRVSGIITGDPSTTEPAFNTSFQISGTPVPEPSTGLATLGLGSIGLMLTALRKRQAQNV